MRYVPRTKHTAADGLSWRPQTELDDINKANEVDIKDFIDAKLNAFSMVLVVVEEGITDKKLLTNSYLEDS